MESRASYLLIGGIAIIFVAALFGFVIWLEQWGFGKPQQRYRVVFGGEATPGSLDQGGRVLFNGIDVGSIQSIRLNPDNRRQALVLISIDADTPVRTDSVARESNQGFTGRSYLAITDGNPDASLLKAKGDQLPTIKAEPGGLSAIMQKAPKIADQVQKLADQASSLIGGGQNQDVGAILKNVRQLTDTLASRDQEIGQMIDDLAAASASVRRAADQAKTLIAAGSQTAQTAQATATDVQKMVASDVEPTLVQARQAAQQTADAAQSVDQLVSQVRPPVERFATDGLIGVRHLVAEARQLVQELRDVADQLRSNPSQFLLGRTQGGFQPEK
jgi:phospholipid/cholesterol/gamma-HCH transport system substrate-binding protein